MALAEKTKSNNISNNVRDTINVLFSKLDEAIDDIENGRVQTIDEAWKEIDAI